MEVRYEVCAGLDVHKQTVVACLMRSGPAGTVVHTTRTFGTSLPELEQLRDWLLGAGCAHAAMEATGVYWKPVYNVLEGHLGLTVANPEHVKAIPRRKTDALDAVWLARLLRHDLVRASYIPDRDQRELRELTRYRTALLQDRARAVNRLQKTLEGANLKLASVLSDVTGASGQRILDALLRGEDDPEALAGLADGRLSAKREALERALAGKLSDRLRFVVGQQLAQVRALDDQIAACDAEVAGTMAPFGEALTRLDAIPGVGRRTAETILAEVGPDVGRFETAAKLAAWAGLAPGNKESGGKRRPARARKGNPWLKRALTEAAWAAGRTKHSYLGAQYRRLAARKGRKRAIVAVGHSILVIAYHLLAGEAEYADLGANYFDERDRRAVERDLVRRLERLGNKVALTPLDARTDRAAA
jgi:transposase